MFFLRYLFVACLLISFSSFAQEISHVSPTPTATAETSTAPPSPVTLLAGNKQVMLQFLVSRELAPGSRFSFFNLTTFNADYKNDQTKNTYQSNSALKYELFNHFSVFTGLGLSYTVGFRPNAGIDYEYASPTWLLVAEPSIDLTQTHNAQTIAVVEFKPALNERWRLYTQAQGLYNYNFEHEEHDLSYLYLRLGLMYHSVQFGLGANFSRFGPNVEEHNNYGLFICKSFR